LKGLRIYLNMNNLLTWTDKYLKYFDPEVATGGQKYGLDLPDFEDNELRF